MNTLYIAPALNSDEKETVKDLRTMADGNKVETMRDEYGLIFELYMDGGYMSGEIAADGTVSWN